MTVHGSKVRLARELRRLTQTELADLSGIKQAAISKIEAGLLEPSAMVLSNIAHATNFPTDFFMQPIGDAVPLGSLLFRSKAATSGRDLAEAHRWGELLFECYRTLATKFERPTVTIPSLAGEPPRVAAEMTRSAIGLGPDSPIENLMYVLEQAGVAVVSIPGEMAQRDAFSTWVGDRVRLPLIVVSRVEAGDRVRFSVAHELGHIVMHAGRGGGRVRDIEQEANKFASVFLLPERAMLAEVTRPVTLASLASLKRRWGVSLQALILRTRDLGLISMKRTHSLFRELSAAGMRLHEAPELDVPVERPRLLRWMAEKAYGNPVDVRAFARDMGLSPPMAAVILNAHAQAAEVRSVIAGRRPRNVVEFKPRPAED